MVVLNLAIIFGVKMLTCMPLTIGSTKLLLSCLSPIEITTMKRTLFFAGILLLASCVQEDPSIKEKELALKEKELELKEKELEMNNAPAETETVTTPAAKAEPKETPAEKPAKSTNAQSDPKKVVEMIFTAAKTGNFNPLMNICDPLGEGDSDTRSLCKIANAGPEGQEEFKEYFKFGQVIGNAVIDGNRAVVQFKFGPQGNRDETMNLVNRNGLWYLSSF
jgi:hypothetical protein